MRSVLLALALIAPLAAAQTHDHAQHGAPPPQTPPAPAHDAHSPQDAHAAHDAQAAAPAADPPVGSLPVSDGAAGRDYAHYGIHPHMLDDAVSAQLSFEKFGLTQSPGQRRAAQWDGAFWIGTDRNRLRIESEGEKGDGHTEAFAQAFWQHAIHPYWDLQLGARRDFGSLARRDWAALGVSGTLPYNVALQATVYAGTAGRSALRLKADYDLRITQRLILSPELEAMVYGKRDRAAQTGPGLSSGSLSLQLRYEVTRQFAPYAGVAFTRQFGATAGMARAAGQRAHDHAWLMGIRFWF